jgi:transmembrane sensor
MTPPEKFPASDAIETAATAWLARRDRTLTAAEQDAYLQWLREDPRHAAAIARQEKVWGLLDQLSEWRPANSPQPNPDLLAPRLRRKIYWLSTAALAAAAAVALAFVVAGQRPAEPAPRRAIIHPGPERQTLADGSVVELNAGAQVDVQFTATERRVRLVRGEAHFEVAKNPERPFVVAAGPVAVRAVGTAFNVSLQQREVSVLVTEGKVDVTESAELAVPHRSDPTAPVPEFVAAPTFLSAGQQAVIALNPAASPPMPTPAVQVNEVTPAQIERALAWQGLRLEFPEMPLGEVVAEFNRYNRRKLVVRDRAAASIIVGGNFRADNVEAFVRLLESSFGVTARTEGEEIVLRLAR